MHLTPLEFILIFSALLEFNPLLQAIKSVRSKKVKDVEPLTFVVIFVIGALWLYYGISTHSIPLIAANFIKLSTSLAVVIIYFVYSRRQV